MGRLLLNSGAEIDAKDTYWTALHNASRGGHAEFVELLLEHNANANVRGLEGNTPLHHAPAPRPYHAPTTRPPPVATPRPHPLPPPTLYTDISR